MFNPSMFFNPALLWLAVGALAPIIIHFAARNRPKRTPFPALRFILASHRRTATKFKIKQLLLLLLRIAALAMFAFVIARPWVEGEATEGRRAKTTVTAVIVLDTSTSMLYEHKKATSFEKAKAAALAAVDAFTLGKSRVCLLFAGPTPQPVVSDFKHALDLEAVKEHIRTAQPSYRGADCAAAVAEAVRMLDDVSGAGKAVFVFTDMTARCWPEAVAAGEKTGNIAIYIVDCGPARPVNPAVLGVAAPDGSSAGIDFEVRARVDAVGVAGRQVELTIDGERRGRKAANAHKVEEIALPASTTTRSAEHWGRVSLTGSDALPVDNHRYFTLRSSPPLNVVLVNGAPSPEPRRDELLNLRTALAPGGIAAGQTFSVSEVTAAEIETAELVTANVIVLCNVGALPARAWAKVRRFVSTGGGLIVFGGDNVATAAYETAAAGAGSLLPCGIGMPRTIEGGTRLEPGRLAHPILQKWKGGRNGDLAAPKFRTHLFLTPKKDADVVLAFKNGDPALIAGKYGTGSVLVYASTCDLDWNAFPRTVPYPILMHEMIKFLIASRQQSRDVLVGAAPALRISDPATVRSITVLRVAAASPRAAKGVEPPGENLENVTDRLDRRSGQLILPVAPRPGLYRVTIRRTGGKDPDERFFAVNLDGEESNMQRLDEDENVVKALFPGREVAVARSENALLDRISKAKSQSELASDLAGIVLAILLGEMYLSNHMRARVAANEAVA